MAVYESVPSLARLTPALEIVLLFGRLEELEEKNIDAHKQRMETAEANAFYRRRKQTVELVYG